MKIVKNEMNRRKRAQIIGKVLENETYSREERIEGGKERERGDESRSCVESVCGLGHKSRR